MTTTLDALIDPDLDDLISSVVSAHTCSDDLNLWHQLMELGLADLTGSAARNGSEASWHEAAALVRALAAHGCSLDVGQSDLVAGWLLDRAGITGPPALRVVDGLTDASPGPGHAPAMQPQRIVLVRRRESGWALTDALPTEFADPTRLVWRDLDEEAMAQARLRLALVRAVQITAALDTITALAIDHAQTREQFGRPIGARQAVQHMVSHIAAESALAKAATDAAILVAATPTVTASQLAPVVAVARSCTGHAVDPVVRQAHQVIGAIGTTREHRLHIFTTMALSLRNQQGTTRDWDQEVLTLATRGAALSDLTLNPSTVVNP